MNTDKKVGICMDHVSAHLIEFPVDSSKDKVVITSPTHQDNDHNHNKSENISNNKEQHHHSEFYRKIAAAIRNYKEVLLFGPTTAKAELLNTLKADHLFEDIHFEVKQTDKMTENQEYAFVKDHFSKIHSS